MRAIVVDHPGGPELLQLHEGRPIPEVGAGEVRVKVRYGSCNFMDVLGRRGDYPVPISYPWIPGSEGVGIVDDVGPAVSHVQEGERVAFIGSQSYGEYALAKEDSCFRLPEELSDELGAAFPIQGLTAYHILHTAGRCRSGEWVVIHAGAGGVGSIAIQLAKRAGLTVIATASSDEKLEFCKSLGADHVHNYSDEDFMKGIRRITEGRGVDLVLDSVGQDTIKTNFRILAMFGRVVAYGLASGMPEVSVAKDLFPKSLGLQAFSLYNVLARPYRLKPSVDELIRLLISGDLQIRIEAILPLAEAEEAHRRLEGRSTMGKVLLET